ncbi:MAG: AMMECR1 domain-containing protein, partial [Candidatus Bipolaricaulota bacterium]
MRSHDPYVALARLTLEEHVRSGRRSSPPPNLPPELSARRAGAFVSLKKGGVLRGCIGTYEPSEDTLAGE